ncbi:MAG: 5-dehydro-4-deoxy-D-glucuronate isomerase, partial [Spirochaetales bacterium]|nr:5-dehydro-4-deoxy-D-glucuronate isomerase [Spirochaetales bacterium]
MDMEIRYANHPDDAKKYTTEEVRKHYLIDTLFVKDEIKLTYSHVDRIIAGGVMPSAKTLTLEAGKEMGVDYFLERRELGVINIGGAGSLVLDGETYKV